MKCALMSIHPRHVEETLAGRKPWEIRRRGFGQPVGSVLIYATVPVGAVVARARVGRILTGDARGLWRLTRGRLGRHADPAMLAEYLGDRTSAVAIELLDIERIGPHPVTRWVPRAPQSYCYV